MSYIKNPKLVIIVLVVLLVLAVMYIAVLKYKEGQAVVFQQGVRIGYEQAISQLIQQVQTCQQVGVNLGNQTVDVIAVECLNKK